MASLERLIDMLQRAKEGKPCTLREWEIKVIPETVRMILKKYDLEQTFNRETPVNQDQELADRFFQAGLELAATIGVLMVDMETIINVSREEILDAIEEAPAALKVGEGAEEVLIKSRSPEDNYPPVFGGPLSIQVSEELYVPIAAGILKNKHIRIQQGPSLDTIFGYPVYSGTPYETALGILENRLRAEAQWRAGRIGIANMSISSSTTEYGQLGGFALQTSKSNPSIAVILHPAELKVAYASFHKAALAIGCNAYFFTGTNSMIGGYSGGAEGAAVANIATDLLQFAVMQADITASSVYDIRFDATCGRHGLWALSIVCQAIARNTHLLVYKVINQSAGPCTEEILYTSAAGLIDAGVSGMSLNIGPRSAGGRFKNYITPLEHWFCAELFEATSRLTLGQANDLVLYLLSRYEENLKTPPKGKSFNECFDRDRLTPSKEWQGIADRVRADIESHGFNLSPIQR